MSFQAPITIAAAIEDIINNRLLLPAIQREFVWTNTQIEWLFDSIMRNYPISSFLFWQVEGDTKHQYKFYSFLQNFRQVYQTHNDEFDTSGVNDFKAVLDGQQRLASIYIGLKGSYAYKLPRLWWDNTEYSIPTRHLYLNIIDKLADEEDGRIYDFQFLTKNKYSAEKDKWFKVGDILKLKNLFEFNKFLDKHNYKANQFSYETLSRLQEAIHTDHGDFHKDHIFAKSLFTKKKLKSLGIKESALEFYLNPENYNSVLNLQLLDGNENKSKQDADFGDWVKKESKNKRLSQGEFCERHLLPKIFDISKFEDFISQRKKKLKDILKKLS